MVLHGVVASAAAAATAEREVQRGADEIGGALADLIRGAGDGSVLIGLAQGAKAASASATPPLGWCGALALG